LRGSNDFEDVAERVAILEFVEQTLDQIGERLVTRFTGLLVVRRSSAREFGVRQHHQ